MKSQIFNHLFPNSLFKRPEWLHEWKYTRDKELILISKFTLIVGAILYLLHIWIFDIPMKLTPIENWIALRICISFCLGLSAAFYFSDRFCKSKYLRFPIVINLFIVSYLESAFLIWWDEMPYFYSFVFAFVTSLTLKIELGKTLIYLLLLLTAQWTSFIISEQSLPNMVSATLITILGVILVKSKDLNEIKFYISERENSEMKQKALQKELELSSAVQKYLMPTKSQFEVGNVQIFGSYFPANECSGDWWWYKVIDDKLLIFLADVTGHGAGPAMVTSAIVSALNTISKFKSNTIDILTELHEVYSLNFSNSNYFMPITAIEISITDKTVNLYWGGSHPIYLFKENNSKIALSKPGQPFGEKDFSLGIETTKIEEGDILFVYSDGIIEEINDKTKSQIGFRPFSQEILQNKQSECKDIANKLSELIKEKRGNKPQSDDYTYVLIKVV
jgi:serine phosphatase RsbU (regulator of sigma subunit)